MISLYKINYQGTWLIWILLTLQKRTIKNKFLCNEWTIPPTVNKYYEKNEMPYLKNAYVFSVFIDRTRPFITMSPTIRAYTFKKLFEIDFQ